MTSQLVSENVVEHGVTSSPSVVASNTLTDTTKNWHTNIYRFKLVRIVAGQGVGQADIIQSNTATSLVVQGGWARLIDAGATYVIYDIDIVQVLRAVFGGGADISAANPLPVDTSPGVKTTQTVLTLANLAAGATSVLADCTGIDLRNGPFTLAVTVVATYNAAAVAGLRVHVRSSPGNVNYDTEDWDAWNAGFTAGVTIRETVNYDTDPMFLRVLIENLDAVQAITGLLVIVSIGA